MTDEIKEETKEDKKPEEVKKPERKDFLKEAKELADRNEKAVAEMRSLTERNEELAARKLLGGDSEAGQPVAEKKEETPQEYMNKVMSGEPQKLKVTES